MKKRILKVWVERALIIFNVIGIIILACEIDNTLLFIISKMLIIFIVFINLRLLEKYGRN